MDLSSGLALYYIFCAIMNGVAALYVWAKLERHKSACVWLVVSLVFVFFSAWSASNYHPDLLAVPNFLKNALDWFSNPKTYTIGCFVSLVVMFRWRRFFSKPTVAWSGLNLALVFMGFSIRDPEVALIISKPDNVPIVGMIFLLGFFTWLATWKAVQNDDRAKQGLGPLEKLDDEKVLVWPDLVYTELICMIALTVVLIVWSICLVAPLEEPGSTVKTPNPSKAPWYFLGLQEMLVYYDPWMAGVVLPSLVVAGLAAIPYIDFNKKGNGYYTIEERPFAYSVFQLGFLQLWVVLIIMGTFLRGPNWGFFGPYETWDAHKVEVLNNVDLSMYFWR
ncbi:MAG: hypothetical protein N2C14_21900, partial [Planctomycetales bacterium]